MRVMWMMSQRCWRGKTLLSGLLLVLASLNAMQLAFASEDGALTLSVAAATKTAKNVQAKLLIEAPPETVWQTLTNYGDLKTILPGYEKAQLTKSQGSTKFLDVAMKVATFLPSYKYQVRVQENKSGYKLDFNRVSGDFRSFVASYRLIPQGNGSHTMLVYNLNIDPGFALPGSQTIIRNNTEKSLKAIERYAEQEARKSLIGQR